MLSEQLTPSSKVIPRDAGMWGLGVLLRRSLLRVALAAVISTVSGAAIALTCGDYATPDRIGTFESDPTPSTGLGVADFVAGDVVTISVRWAAAPGSGSGALTIDFNTSSSVNFASGSVTVSGTSQPTDLLVGTATIPSAMPYFEVRVQSPAFWGSSTEYELYLTCTPASSGGGGSGGGGSPTPSATIQSIQQSQTRVVAERSTGMIGGMVRSVIDSAFAGGSDTDILAMGYAGSLVLDATPEELLGSGVSLWTGVRYELALPDTGQWGGGQASVGGGLNYRIDESWIVGVFATYEAAGYSQNGSSDTLGSSGFGLGVMTAYHLDEAWRVELIGNLSRLNYAIASGTTTANVDATRVHIDAGLAGNIPIAATIDFVPRIGFSVMREDQAAYTDSASVAHAAASLYSTEAMAGGKLLFYPLGEGTTFSVGGGGSLGNEAGFSADLDAGAMFELAPNVRLAIDAGLNGLAGNRPLTVALQAKLSGEL